MAYRAKADVKVAFDALLILSLQSQRVFNRQF